MPAPKFDLSIDDLESDNISIEQLRVEVTEMIKKLSSEHFNFQEEAFIQQSELQWVIWTLGLSEESANSIYSIKQT